MAIQFREMWLEGFYEEDQGRKKYPVLLKVLFSGEPFLVMRQTKRRPVTVGQMLMTEFWGAMTIEISDRS